jgi:hypothetical protein
MAYPYDIKRMMITSYISIIYEAKQEIIEELSAAINTIEASSNQHWQGIEVQEKQRRRKVAL